MLVCVPHTPETAFSSIMSSYHLALNRLITAILSVIKGENFKPFELGDGTSGVKEVC